MTLTIKISYGDVSPFFQETIAHGREISNYYKSQMANPNATIIVIASGEELKKCCSILGRDMPFSPSERLLVSNPWSPILNAEQLKKLLEKEYTFYGDNAREIVSNWDNWQ